MRGFYAILLILFLAVIAIFAFMNMERITVNYPGGSWEVRFAILIGAVYVLGMFSGWSVVGVIKKSLKRVTEHRG